MSDKKKNTFQSEAVDFLSGVRKQTEGQAVPVQQTVGKVISSKKKESKMPLTVNVPEDLYYKLDKMLPDLYPPTKRQRNRAVIEALELWLSIKEKELEDKK